MLADIRTALTTDPDAVAREALGLAALVVVILAALFLPGLA